jgi:hypothetical protein
VALRSDVSSGSTFDTDWERFAAGVRGRLRTSEAMDGPVIALTGEYGEEKFAFGQTSIGDTAPSVDYRFVRIGTDLRVPLGRFSLVASGAGLAVLSAGDLTDRFSRASVAGIDAMLGASFTIVPGLEARLLARYRRFFYSMHPVPGDAYVAGGALDELGGLQGSLAYAY